ncbi:MAG: hypothetical protein ABT05_06600 [Lautropia sp. SCN 66-9]|nr:MAG: hypothetical protein ABT05_06600 [Lautropia sp. SCN 66-9]
MDAPKFGERRLGRFMMQVLWPAFLVAIVAEGLLFSLFDPHQFGGDAESALSREAAYTIGFFALWALFACSSALSWLLAQGGSNGNANNGSRVTRNGQMGADHP